MIRIAIIVGSTRPGRRARMVADWVHDIAESEVSPSDGIAYDVVDLAEHDLPLLDEPAPAALGDYRGAHTRRWAATINSYDGFVVVTPEYNHSVPAALKNAFDFLFAEWNDKAAALVSYGVHGGVRAAEQLRLTLAELKIADVRTQVALSLFNDFQITDPIQPGVFAPGEHHRSTLTRMLDELTAWAGALQVLRTANAPR